MAWSFWKKKSEAGELPEAKVEKLPKPHSIPESVGRALVVNLGKDPNWVWQLKSVVRPQSEKNHYDIRVFDEGQASLRGVVVKDYTTFDEYPDLVLFEGWYDKKTHIAKLEDKLDPAEKAA
jgi:hypothetical protein